MTAATTRPSALEPMDDQYLESASYPNMLDDGRCVHVTPASHEVYTGAYEVTGTAASRMPSMLEVIDRQL